MTNVLIPYPGTLAKACIAVFSGELHRAAFSTETCLDAPHVNGDRVLRVRPQVEDECRDVQRCTLSFIVIKVG